MIWVLYFIPTKFMSLLGSASLILVGILAEKYYTGRLTLFANAIALITFFGSLPQIPIWIEWYTNIITILGIIGLLSYGFKKSISTEFYTIAKIGGSIITGLVLLYGLSL